MCWVTQHQSRSLQMWKILTNTPSTLTFCLLQKMTSLVWTFHSWQAFNSFVCPLILRTNNRCVESLNISVMSPNVDYLSVIQNDLSWLNNLFMVNFQLISMSTYAKNKQQMCCVTQHQCRSLQIWKILTNTPSTFTFCLLQKND